ncbi:hypothetical protein [Rhodococcus sp. 1139]|uniref:hypothetical protein n=1 Tax=Rhodococcus sp. 1139 TaxID=1833762 RepID=UPI0008730819|nr:hypothetical protein [Rhodococcus sp. 1139]OFE10838.1 hypothetical protein A5N83_00540 [Rhodococcus sp. 1139]
MGANPGEAFAAPIAVNRCTTPTRGYGSPAYLDVTAEPIAARASHHCKQAALGGSPATVFGDRDRRAMRAGEDGGTSARSLLRPTDRPVISPCVLGR